MKCRQIEKLLSSYLENELSQEEKVLVENHIEKCSECSGLLSYMREAKNSMAEIPEIEVSPSLMRKLVEIPNKKPKRRFSFLLKPSLQPLLAAATVLITVISLYSLNPNKEQINKFINQQIHIGYSKAERLYARAESLTNTLAGYKESLLFSIKNIDFFWEKNDRPND
jgi:predicted anti-sigma-YlaC factor YlaD